MPGMIEDDGTSSGGSVSTPSSLPPSPRAANARNQKSSIHDAKRRALGLNIQGSEGNAAVGSEIDSAGGSKGKKRSFGQYDAATNQQPGPASVHQHLRRALIDGGIGGRSNRSSPSIYSANSPFSTPGNSIPSTPLTDDNEFAFGGNNSLAAFSSMSLRPHGEDLLPACAPPNLFFPNPGSSSSTSSTTTTTAASTPAPNTSVTSQPPAKRERKSSTDKDKDGQPVAKPFKCPNPDCDKAYKQANGLKYHRIHGSCNMLADGSTPSASSSQSKQAQPAKRTSPTASRRASINRPTPIKSRSPPTASPAAPQAVTSNATPTRAPQASQSGAPPAAASTKPTGNQSASQQPQRPQQQTRPMAGATNIPGANVPPNRGVNVPGPGARPNGTNGAVNQSPAAGGNNMNKGGALAISGNLTSAALAAAGALLQRNVPLPNVIQSPNGPVDSASLIKHLNVLQHSLSQQQNSGGQPMRAQNFGQVPNGPNNNAASRFPQQGNSVQNAPRPGAAGSNGANAANQTSAQSAMRPSPGPAGGAPGGAMSPTGVRASPSLAPAGQGNRPVRSGNLTNTQPTNSPGGLSMNKPPSPAGSANATSPSGLSATAPTGSQPGKAGPTNGPGTPSQQKPNLASSGITPQMLAAAQQAAAQKRAQQAGAQQRST